MINRTHDIFGRVQGGLGNGGFGQGEFGQGGFGQGGLDNGGYGQGGFGQGGFGQGGGEFIFTILMTLTSPHLRGIYIFAVDTHSN